MKGHDLRYHHASLQTFFIWALYQEWKVLVYTIMHTPRDMESMSMSFLMLVKEQPG